MENPSKPALGKTNWLLVLLAIVIAGGTGYWLGQNKEQFPDGSNLLKREDFFSITPKGNLKALAPSPIHEDSARSYTARYKALIDANVIVGGQTVRLRDILHPTPLGSSTFADYPYFRIDANTIKAIMGDSTLIKRLCIFPSIKMVKEPTGRFRREFTLVLVGEKTNNDLERGVIYDEIDVCPPPVPCKNF